MNYYVQNQNYEHTFGSEKNFFVQNYTYAHIYIKIRTFEHIIKW